LTEDVAYIITDQERAAFVHLNSAPECSMFVEQFWLRREPDFKAEHYRRIAYANAHFASARNAGWQTDRARVYITYGPPDEIEFHPRGGDQGHADPFAQWLYHHVDAQSRDILFEFVDAARDSEFRLAFMGGVTDKREIGGPVVFGPIGQLYVQVNNDRTLFITTPVRGASATVNGKILDRAGALIQTFEDLTQASMYGRQISNPLPAGQYTLQLNVGPENRSIVFEVK
jgi:GWxTD domain-containing protein